MPADRSGPIRVIIDADPGVDDFLAILLAFRSPELDVRAITTVGGNCPLEMATTNALRVIEDAGREDVPVHPGAEAGIAGPFSSAFHVHGESGLTIDLPAPATRPSDTGALDAMMATLDEEAGLVIVALGPLTNIARLISRQPALARRVEQLFVMGGAVDTPGNVTPHAEFNIWNDPEAANVVFESGLRVSLVGIDVCKRVRLARRDVKKAVGTVRRLMDAWFDMRPRGDRFTMYDPLTVASVIDSRILEYEESPMEALTEGEERGRTVRANRGERVHVAMGVDESKALSLFGDRLFK